MAEPTGLEPATSSVTGKRSNQLSYGSKLLNETLGHPPQADTAPEFIRH